MVIHFPTVNLLHFASGLKAEHVLIMVAPYKVVTLMEEIWLCGQVLG